MNRPNTDHPDWNLGIPDFVEENASFKRDLIALTVLALGFASGVLFMLF